MKKRAAFTGAAIAILAVGLAGAVLHRTGIIPGQTLTVPVVTPPQVETYAPGPNNPGLQAALERRQLPAPESGEVAAGTGGQTAPPPQPEGTASSRGEPGPNVQEGPSQPNAVAEKPDPVQTPSANKPQCSGPAHPESGGRNTVRPLVIRFRFNPALNRGMRVALVHSGDRISVKVRCADQANCKLYLTFGFANALATSPSETDAYLEWSAGPRSVSPPAWDVRPIYLTGADDFDADLPGGLDSKEGAVLKLGADCSWRGRSLYEIEVRIYPGKRWNIRPKSLV